MPLEPDGINAAAAQEKKAHPTTSGGQPITAWDRRATTLNTAIQTINKQQIEIGLLADRLEELEEWKRNRPF